MFLVSTVWFVCFCNWTGGLKLHDSSIFLFWTGVFPFLSLFFFENFMGIWNACDNWVDLFICACGWILGVVRVCYCAFDKRVFSWKDCRFGVTLSVEWLLFLKTHQCVFSCDVYELKGPFFFFVVVVVWR